MNGGCPECGGDLTIDPVTDEAVCVDCEWVAP